MAYAQLAAEYQKDVRDKVEAHIKLPEGLELGSDVSKVAEQLLSAEHLRITSLDCTDLLEEIATGRLSSVEAVTAFGLRTALAHQVTNCLTDFFLDEAIARGKELDDYLAKHGKVVGPLHGLPISTKDQVTLKGKLTSLSFTSLHQTAEPEPTDAQLVRILKDAGAVFFTHTTLPQTIMHLECNSRLWGRTLLPFNTSLSAGGSSGGEGAVLGFKGAPLGLGTDIGGSVRSPAANNGCYGLRATAQRIPNAGVRTYVPGRDSVLGIVGPLARSARDIELFMSIATGEKAAPWKEDPSILEMPWRQAGARLGGWEDGQRKLRVGVMWHDGEVRPTRPIARVLKDTVDKLKASAEIEVVDFAPWKTREGWNLVRQLYFADGGKRIRDLTVDSAVQEPLEPLTTWLLEEAGPPVRQLSIHELWEVNIARDQFRKGFHAHWQHQGIDVLLCPVAPYPAPPHGTAKWWAYTSHFNLTDFPAIAFPVGGRVDPELDSMTPEEALNYVPLSEDDRIAHESYSAERYANAPLALQLVAIRNHDEELLSALEVVERIIKE